MTDRQYVRLNTSISTASNSKNLLKDEDGNVQAVIDLRLPENTISKNEASGTQIIDMLPTKIRVSMSETPIAQIPLDTELSTSLNQQVSACQLDVYPYCLLEHNQIMPDPSKPLIPEDPSQVDNISALPYYKDHTVQANFIYTKFDTTPTTDIALESLNWISNSQNYGFPKTSRFYPLVEKSKLLQQTNHMMNLTVQSNLERYQIENDQLFVKRIGTLQQMIEDAFENAVTFGSTSSFLNFNVYLIDVENIPEDISPLPDLTNTVELIEYEVTVCLWKIEVITNGDDKSTVSNKMAFACKPGVTLGEQSLSIAYDTAAFKDVVPVLWNTSYIRTWDVPEQMTLDKWRKEQWGQPPPKRTYKFNCNVDENGQYSFTLPNDSNCAPVNIIANKATRDTFSFLPWIDVDFTKLPEYSTTSYNVKVDYVKHFPKKGTDLIKYVSSDFRTFPWYVFAQDPSNSYSMIKYKIGTTENTWDGEYSVFNTETNRYACVMYVKIIADLMPSSSQDAWDITTSENLYDFGLALAEDAPKQEVTLNPGETVILGDQLVFDDTSVATFDEPYHPDEELKQFENYTTFQEVESSSVTVKNDPVIPISDDVYKPVNMRNVRKNNSFSFVPYNQARISDAYTLQDKHRNFFTLVKQVKPNARFDVDIADAGYLAFYTFQNWTHVEGDAPGVYTKYYYWKPYTYATSSDTSSGQIVDNKYWNNVYFTGNIGHWASLSSSLPSMLAKNVYSTPYQAIDTSVTTNSLSRMLIEPNIDITDNKFYILDGTTSEVNVGQQEVTQVLKNPYKWKLTKYDCNWEETNTNTVRTYYWSGDPLRVDPPLPTNFLTGKIFLPGITTVIDGIIFEHTLVLKYMPVGGGTYDVVSLKAGITGLDSTNVLPDTYYTSSTSHTDPILIMYAPSPTWSSPTNVTYSNPRDAGYSNDPSYTEGEKVNPSPYEYTEPQILTESYFGRFNNDFSSAGAKQMLLIENLNHVATWEDCTKLSSFGSISHLTNNDTDLLYIPPLEKAIYHSTQADEGGYYYYVWTLSQNSDGNCDLSAESIDPSTITVVRRPYVLNFNKISDALSANRTLVTLKREGENTVDIVSENETSWIYSGNERLTFTWNNLPVVVMSPIQSIVLVMDGIRVNNQVQPVNLAQPGGSSLTTTIPMIESYFSTATTLRDLHDELVIAKDHFTDAPVIRVDPTFGSERTLRFRIQYITKDGGLHQLYIPDNGIFSLQLSLCLYY